MAVFYFMKIQYVAHHQPQIVRHPSPINESDYIPKISVITYMLYFCSFLIVCLLFLLIAINVEVYGACELLKNVTSYRRSHFGGFVLC